jgi:hypothetical protein
LEDRIDRRPNGPRLRPHGRFRGASGEGKSGVQKLFIALRRLSWALALLLALVAAFVYRRGYEEEAAIIWLVSLIILLPIWRQQE